MFGSLQLDTTQKAIAYVIVFIVGLLIGSFANVVIYRVPQGKSIVNPGSFCPNCKNPIAWYDNIPLVSYLFLGGSCRKCGKKISPIYPLVELLNGVLFGATAALVRPIQAVPFCLVFETGLLILSVIDLKIFKLPSVVIYWTLGFVAPLMILASFLTNNFHRLEEAALTAVIAFVCFLLLFFLAPKGGFGLGDVRLSFLQGLVLGWFGYKIAFISFIAGFILGGFAGLTLIAFGRKKMKDKLAFGPYLALGAVLALLSASSILKPWSL
jgi:leader peptidase (prepilin peptidase)/N-methyltransferase